jgi:hypothetical protein
MTTLQLLENTPEENQLMRLDTAIGDLMEGVPLTTYGLNGLDWVRQLYPKRLNEKDQLAPISTIRQEALQSAFEAAELARQERILKILAGRA